ncbi:MAG: hypothetical protein AAGI91_13325 [Bacteroidota bacterium]
MSSFEENPMFRWSPGRLRELADELERDGLNDLADAARRAAEEDAEPEADDPADGD